MNCLICGSSSILTLEPFDDPRHRVEHCNDCRYETLRPLPTPAELLAYYSAYSTTKTDPAELRVLFEQSLEFFDYFVRTAGLDHSELHRLNFLEIGFGNAASLLGAANAGFRAYGIDLDESNVRAARERSSEYGVQVDCAALDIQQYRRDIPLHVVKASQVIEHTLDPLTFLREIHERQPPGGYLIIECPNNEAAFWYVKNALRRPFDRMNFYKSLKITEHLSGFTANSLAMLLGKVGYSVVFSRDYSVRDKLFQPENTLWYPTIAAGLRAAVKWNGRPSLNPYPFLKSLIGVFDKAASTLAHSGTYLAVWARKLPA